MAKNALSQEKRDGTFRHFIKLRRRCFRRRGCPTLIDGCQAMRYVSEQCPYLKGPSRIRSTALRKYFATTSQVLDMAPSELRMIADHMGHSVNIHTDVYRLQSSVLERTKVARILLAAENGTLNRFKEDRWRLSVLMNCPCRSITKICGKMRVKSTKMTRE